MPALEHAFTQLDINSIRDLGSAVTSISSNASSSSSGFRTPKTSNGLPVTRSSAQAPLPPPWLLRQNNLANSELRTAPSAASSTGTAGRLQGRQSTSSHQQRSQNQQSQRQNHQQRGPRSTQGSRGQNLPDYERPQEPVLVCYQLPQNTYARVFRKAVGAAIKKAFPDPPTFRATVRSKRGTVEFGQVTFPNLDCCNIFMRWYGPQARDSVEIAKHRLRFERPKPGTVRITEQEIKSLIFKPNTVAVDTHSDYENSDEERAKDLYVLECELGGWDSKGRFASAWKSNVLDDHYSVVDLDGDSAKLTVRLSDRLISISLYSVEKLVVHGKDLYIYTTALPTYLQDITGGIASLTRRVGIMKFNGLDSVAKFVRTPGLDSAHEKIAPFCYVVKVRCTNRADLDHFLLRWRRKLIDIVAYIDIEQNTDQPYRNGILRKLNEWYASTSFELSFQVHGLVQSGLLTPLEVWELTLLFKEIDRRLDPPTAAVVVRTARSGLRHHMPGEVSVSDADAFAQRLKEQLWQAEEAQRSPFKTVHEDTGYHQIHAAVITPAGLWLDGPQRDTGNRIVRAYPGKETHFLRVRIQDESGDLIRDSREVDQDEQIFSGKVQKLFLEGLRVGGRLFRFLGFSTSSLREHSTWFVSDFVYEGEAVSADSIRATIGDLSNIKVPARYAARMGQAFTSTAFQIDVPFERRLIVEDVKIGTKRYNSIGNVVSREYIFSDGCGTLSRASMEKLHEKDARIRRNKRKTTLPVVFQVRIGGAKGVLSLNSEQTGSDVMLRESMVKFETNEVDHPHAISLEVASSADAPLSTNLNRPLVALLETLGVPPSNFLRIQEQAVADLRLAVTDTVAALRLYRSYGVGIAAESSDLLQTLHRVLGIKGITDVAFLKRCNLTVLTSALRMIKYKARCKVDQAWTLIGIMDESGLLDEGQVYVQLREGQDANPQFLKGWCLVGRSPYLAAGDVQYATLIGRPPPGHPLLNLHNCVVFSRRGRRPLPSMLSGGDLDGDLYNVFQNPLLMPPKTRPAGEFDSETPKSLPRPVTWEDVVNFFLLYCQTDRLGMIADRHLCIADRSAFGVEDRQCEKLAQLASVAVDYQKTGVPPDLRNIPRLEDPARPDFCQSEHRVEGRRAKERSRWARLNLGYYESPKALGQMFRAISVSADIDSWGRNISPVKSESEIRLLYWNKIRPWLPDNWLPGGDEDMAAVQVYYSLLDGYANDYAPERRREDLSEEECFMGVILSRFGTRFTGSRGYSAQIGLKDDISGLIDQTMSNFCDTQEWNEPRITPKSLRDLSWNYTTPEGEREAKMARLKADKDFVQYLVIRLARWIRASEMFEEVKSPAVSNLRRNNAEGGEHWTHRRYEGAKWIAIAPILKKIEELEMWNLWFKQMTRNMGSRAV